MKKLILTLTFCVSISGLIYGQKCRCFDFVWKGDTISGRYIPNVAINIPVAIDDLPYKFDMQFDLGAVTTVFYGNSIEPYLRKHSKLRQKIDSTLTFHIQSQKNVMFKDIDLGLGKVKFKEVEIGLFSGFGDSLAIDSINTKTSKHIGTIASDLFQNKILIIDYPNKRICIAEKMPQKYRKLNYQDFILEEGQIKIPFLINDKIEMLMFDTGSSLFSLITTKESAQQISDRIVSDSLRITSWGEYYTVYGEKVKSSISFANKNLPSTLVYYFEQPIFDQFFKQENIWGVTGNAYFLKNRLIIDYKNKKIGIE